ncbi:MAG: hypothetical protein ACOYL6_08770 [Bacteriovoracaceae bacterium]
MKVYTKEIPLDLLKDKLLTQFNHFSYDYHVGFTFFIEGFFSAVEVFDVIDGGDISTSSCAEHALKNVKRRRQSIHIGDEKVFYQGSMDACQKILQLFELSYSDIQAA